MFRYSSQHQPTFKLNVPFTSSVHQDWSDLLNEFKLKFINFLDSLERNIFSWKQFSVVISEQTKREGIWEWVQTLQTHIVQALSKFLLIALINRLCSCCYGLDKSHGITLYYYFLRIYLSLHVTRGMQWTHPYYFIRWYREFLFGYSLSFHLRNRCWRFFFSSLIS